MRRLGLALVALVVWSTAALAAERQSQRGQGRGRFRPQAMQRQNNRRAPGPSALELAEKMGLEDRFVFRLTAEVNKVRRDRARALASRTFEKIARGDWRGERVVYADNDVVAFLDKADPQHPEPDLDMESEEDAEAIPLQNRAHVLVIPKQKREHVARSLGGDMTEADLQASLQVVQSARKIAQQLGLTLKVPPKISGNPMIGWLHVHLIGERNPAQPYPNLRR